MKQFLVFLMCVGLGPEMQVAIIVECIAFMIIMWNVDDYDSILSELDGV